MKYLTAILHKVPLAKRIFNCKLTCGYRKIFLPGLLVGALKINLKCGKTYTLYRDNFISYFH